MRSTLAFALVLAFACERPAPPAKPTSSIVTLTGHTMGTTWSTKIVAKDDADAARARALQVDIERVLKRVNDQMSTYIPSSELSKFNASTSTSPVKVSKALASVTARALEIGDTTGGAFDVTLGPVIELWGFDKTKQANRVPSDEVLEKARARVGLHKVHAGEDTLKKDLAALEVNLSGIAKGYGVDEVFALLSSFSSVMVEIGGEVRVRGQKPNGKPWTLGVNVPRSSAAPDAVLRTVPLSDGALATSGDYRNFFEAGGKRFSHIIDPASGRPVDHEIVSATILAPDCATADAFATAAMVMGATRAKALIERLPQLEALFVERTGGELATSTTSGFPAP